MITATVRQPNPARVGVTRMTHRPSVQRVVEQRAGGLPLHRDYLDLILHGTPR